MIATRRECAHLAGEKYARLYVSDVVEDIRLLLFVRYPPLDGDE